MRNGFRFIGLAAMAALSLTAMALQDAVIVKRAAKVGDAAKYRMKAELDYQGTPVTFTGLISEKVTKVTATGDYTVESKTTEGKINFGGNEMDAGDQAQSATQTTFKATGEVLNVVSDLSDPNLFRMANLQSIQFPATPLKVGDSWTIEIKKDDKGSVDAKGTYKVEAMEKIGEYDTYRIHGALKEDIKDQPASVDATYWVNVKDGSLVKLSGTWTNAPFPQVGPITAKVSMAREG